MPDKPFFVYFAPGATHAPHHVPKEWSDKYKGKFDSGWDKLREETIARQKKLGVIPQRRGPDGAHKEIPGWDEMPANLQAGARPADGDLRWISRADGPSRRPVGRRARRPRRCSTTP